MATQHITLIKIGGKSGTAVIRAFRAWNDTHKTRDRSKCHSEQWPPSARRQMDRLIAALREHRHEPPVLFFLEYVDLWSSFGLFEMVLSPEGGNKPVRVVSDGASPVYCYPLPDGGVLADSLRRRLRSRRITGRMPPEDRWFVTFLLEAVLAWESLADTSALVIVREPIDVSDSDTEVSNRLKGVAGWIRMSI